MSCSEQAGSSDPTNYQLAESYGIEDYPEQYDTLFGHCLKLPCVLELWKHPRKDLQLLRSGNQMMLVDKSHNVYSSWPADWSRLNGALRYCIGDPLGHETYGFKNGEVKRSKTLTENGYWQLHFDEPNPCELKGTLVLNATNAQINTEMLLVSDTPWKQGGAAKLERIFAAEQSSWVKEELRLEKTLQDQAVPQ